MSSTGRAVRAREPGEQAEARPAWPHLGEMAVPTLVVVGRLDADDILAINPQVAELIPGARLQWLDGVPHVPHLEGDAATLDAIEAFVRNYAR